MPKGSLSQDNAWISRTAAQPLQTPEEHQKQLLKPAETHIYTCQGRKAEPSHDGQKSLVLEFPSGEITQIRLEGEEED